MHHDSSRSVPAASVAATETLRAAAECMQRSGSHQLAVVDETGVVPVVIRSPGIMVRRAEMYSI